MNAMTVFEDRKQDFLAQLERAQGAAARAEAAGYVLEQIACILAQEETDDGARQRQQAVLAMAKKAPCLLAAAGAEGELVIVPRSEPEKKLPLSRKTIGAALLALLAVVELIDGRILFAVLQLAGGGLALLGGGTLPALAARAGQARARGVATLDATALLERLGTLCRAVDICTEDLSILEKESSVRHISGTADETTLDLLVAMLEAKASGRSDAAARTLDQAEQYLRMLGVEALYDSEENAAYFDVLPTLGDARTIRPALLRDGKLIRRGVAARRMERSVGA